MGTEEKIQTRSRGTNNLPLLERLGPSTTKNDGIAVELVLLALAIEWPEECVVANERH